MHINHNNRVNFPGDQDQLRLLICHRVVRLSTFTAYRVHEVLSLVLVPFSAVDACLRNCEYIDHFVIMNV